MIGNGFFSRTETVRKSAATMSGLMASLQEAAGRKRELALNHATLGQQIAGLRSEYETEEMELRRMDEQAGTRTIVLTVERTELARLRHADVNGNGHRQIRGGLIKQP
jgi:molybdopterin converting factor small subunit